MKKLFFEFIVRYGGIVLLISAYQFFNVSQFFDEWKELLFLTFVIFIAFLPLLNKKKISYSLFLFMETSFWKGIETLWDSMKNKLSFSLASISFLILLLYFLGIENFFLYSFLFILFTCFWHFSSMYPQSTLRNHGVRILLFMCSVFVLMFLVIYRYDFLGNWKYLFAALLGILFFEYTDKTFFRHFYFRKLTNTNDPGDFGRAYLYYLKQYVIIGILITVVYQGGGFALNTYQGYQQSRENTFLEAQRQQELERLRQLALLDNNKEQNSSRFNDLQRDHWAYDALVLANDRGLFETDEQNNIFPGNSITFIEMYAILFEAFDVVGFENEPDITFNFINQDDDGYEIVKKAYYQGLVGRGFDVTRVVTRKYFITNIGILDRWQTSPAGDVFSAYMQSAEDRGVISQNNPEDYDTAVNRAVVAKILAGYL